MTLLQRKVLSCCKYQHTHIFAGEVRNTMAAVPLAYSEAAADWWWFGCQGMREGDSIPFPNTNITPWDLKQGWGHSGKRVQTLVHVDRRLQRMQDRKKCFLWGPTLQCLGTQCFFCCSFLVLCGWVGFFPHVSLEISVSACCLTPLTISDLSFLCFFLLCIL